MYKVIADSSADLDHVFLERFPTTLVPFKLYLDGKEYVDDGHLDVDAFVQAMGQSRSTPKSACPSPSDFLEQFNGEADELYVVTISSKLSGTYNSATLAKSLYEADHPGEKFIHIFDSLGAAAGETLLVRKLHDLLEQGIRREALVATVEAFISEMRVLFISESLTNLIKNGRISVWKGLLAQTLHILPIMGSDGHGEIKLIEKVRNTNKAYRRLVEIVQQELIKGGKKLVTITHVGNMERVNQLMSEILKIDTVEEVIQTKCAGLSSLYADNRGIVLAF